MAKLHLLWNCLFYVTISRVTGLSKTISPGRVCNPTATCRQGNSGRCECDSLCNLYNDCCVDVYRDNGNLSSVADMKFSCLPLIPNYNMYVVDRCSKFWIGSIEVRGMCETLNDFIDPLMSIPATDTETGITYRNRYCAECNMANSDDLSSWLVTLACSSLLHVQLEHSNITQDFIVNNIIRVGNTWGVYHWNQNYGNNSFYQCDVSFSLPSHLSYYVRKCYVDIVDECAFDWDDEQTQQLCEFYMSVVFDVKGQVYRNIHCAICNYIPMNDITCYGIGGYPGVPFAEESPVYGLNHPTLNFAILLDVNPDDGNKVGVKSPCTSNQIFDPFTRKCRSLVCAVPGFVRKKNKCVRQ